MPITIFMAPKKGVLWIMVSTTEGLTEIRAWDAAYGQVGRWWLPTGRRWAQGLCALARSSRSSPEGKGEEDLFPSNLKAFSKCIPLVAPKMLAPLWGNQTKTNRLRGAGAILKTACVGPVNHKSKTRSNRLGVVNTGSFGEFVSSFQLTAIHKWEARFPSSFSFLTCFSHLSLSLRE